MAELPPLPDADACRMVQLLGETAALTTGRRDQIHHLMDGLRELLQADCWVWGLSVKPDPNTLPAWVLQHRQGFTDEQWARYIKAQEHPDMGPITAPFMQLLQERQSHLTRLRQQTDPEDRFSQSGAWQLWHDAGCMPGILSVRPLNASTASVVAFHRRPEAPFFSQRESRIAHILLSEVRWLHVPLGENSKVDALPSLSPRLRSVFNLLVQGFNRKEIAKQLGITPQTAATYAREVYRHFGMHSQAEFMQRFLYGDGGDA